MVLADTGFWLALLNPRDRHHARAAEVAREMSEPLISTWPVVTETSYLLSTRLGARAQEEFLRSQADGAFEIASTDVHPLARVLPLIVRYRELPMDLADASLVLLAEHLGHGRIVSTDRRDFRTYRWKSHAPFENLLEPL